MGAKTKPKRRRSEPRRFAPGVCIAGMHRSGTSMIAHVLHECGLCLGDPEEMLPPSPTNPDGYWENTSFVALNERLLNANAAQWDQPPDAGLGISDATLPFRGEAEALVLALAGQGIWGWKDPRNSLTVPFWREVAPKLRFVICLRNPLEVALSLATRNGLSYESGLDLWYRYNACLMATTDTTERIIVHYAKFISDPATEIGRLCASVNLKPNTDQISNAFLVVRGNSRHYRLGLQHLVAADTSPPIVSLYSAMCAEASFDLAQVDAGMTQDVPVSVHTSAPLRQHAVIEVEALRHQLVASQAEHAVLSERARTLTADSQIQVNQLEELRGRLEATETARSALARASEERDRALGEVRAASNEIASVRGELESAAAEASGLRRELESSKSRMSQLGRDLESARTETVEARRELRATSSIAELQALRTRDLSGQVASLSSDLNELRGERAKQGDRVTQLTLEVRQLDAAFADLRVVDARKEAQLRQRDSQIVNLKRSLSTKDDEIVRLTELLATDHGKLKTVENELADKALELHALEERARVSETALRSDLGQLQATLDELQSQITATRDRVTQLRRFDLARSLTEARVRFRHAMDMLFGRTYRATLEPLAELERVPGHGSRWASLGVDPHFDVLPPLPSGLARVSITGSSSPESVVTLYVDEGSGFTESAAYRLGGLSPKEQTLTSEIVLGRPRRIRLDPMDQPGTCEVSAVVFRVPHAGSRIIRALRARYPGRGARVA